METFNVSFERALGAGESKQNIPFTVQVPAGTTRVLIRLSFTPAEVDGIRNMLTLTVFDPSGWRGEGHRGGDWHEVTIAEDRATPGYLVKPVTAGTWTVVVNTHMVMPGEPCQMALEVWGTDEPAQGRAPASPKGHTAPRGPGWYRGDIHAHTVHSDARWDVDGLVAYARAHRFDFATLSDHNTIAGLAEMDAAGTDDLLIMGGMELTTFWGHALALGLRDWIDWRTSPDGQSMEGIAADVTRRGGLFIIAHPRSVGDPLCTGCDWMYPQVMPGEAHVVEVWNNDWGSDSNSEEGLKLAFAWLNQGCRLAFTAGTDNHGETPPGYTFPCVVVHAQELSEKEILRAIRAGHLYLSCGPELALEAEMGDRQAGMGDVLAAGAKDTIDLTVRWGGCPSGARLDFIVDGESLEALAPESEGTRTWHVNGCESHWGLVTLRDEMGKMLALTNPIFWDGRD
jgi:hypothetical protein